MLAADLGDAFRLPGLEPAKLKETSAATLAELESFQCEDGGFGYWKGDCRAPSPYLTSYVLHVMQRGRGLGHAVPETALERGYGFLEQQLAADRPANEGWWPAYTAWQAFAVKVLVEAGRNQDAHLTRLYGYRERMPVFALAYRTEGLIEIAENVRSQDPERVLRMAENAMDIALIGLAAVTAVLVATDLIRLVRR